MYQQGQKKKPRAGKETEEDDERRAEGRHQDVTRTKIQYGSAWAVQNTARKQSSIAIYCNNFTSITRIVTTTTGVSPIPTFLDRRNHPGNLLTHEGSASHSSDSFSRRLGKTVDDFRCSLRRHV